MHPATETPPPDQPPSRSRLTKAAKTNPAKPKTSKPKVVTPKVATIRVAAPIQAQISFNWSSSARLALANSSFAASRLNKVVRTSIRATLDAAPPRYSALLAQLKGVDSPLFTLDMSWISDAEIQVLNRDYRGKNKPTDVLSFALFEAATEEDELPFPVFPGEESQIALGDLVISMETAMRQAGEQNHDLTREIAFLSIHGTLHLLGYDHAKPGERRAMFALQDAIHEALQEALF